MIGTTSKQRHWIIPVGGLLLLGALGCGGRGPVLGGGATFIPPVPPTAPTVTAVAPVNNATAVSVNLTVVTANFSEAMAPITGAATFTVTAPSPALTPVGVVTLDTTKRIASFTFTGPLTASTVYTGTVTGATSLATGLALAAPYVWHFTTGLVADTTRPLVTLTVPTSVLPAATNVATNTAITATFSEDMAPLTIVPASGPATFTLTSGAAVATAGTVSYSVVGRTATFTPTTTLVAATLYTATITLAATDLASNALAGVTATPTVAANHVWTFTTAAAPDIIAPTITLTNPADLATNVALNASVNATYSEAMNAGSIAFKLLPTSTPLGTPLVGVLGYDALTHISTFTPTNPLIASTSYTATITAATDLAGNALIAGTKPNPWTFTTGAAVLPPGVPVGSAGAFGIMATLAITDAGGSTINGDVALNPGSSCGLLPSQVNGTIFINDVGGVSLQAKIDLLATYNYCMALPSTATTPSGGDLGAWAPPGSTLPAGTLPPGVYTNGSTMMVSSVLTLDAGGDPNAIWVFQIGSSLTTTTPLGNVVLAGGALAKNVFWVTVSDATVGVNTIFNGTIVAGRNATGQTGAVINGRILCGATNPGTIALDSNTVTVPAP